MEKPIPFTVKIYFSRKIIINRTINIKHYPWRPVCCLLGRTSPEPEEEHRRHCALICLRRSLQCL